MTPTPTPKTPSSSRLVATDEDAIGANGGVN